MTLMFAQQKDKEHYIAFSAAIDMRNVTTGSDASYNKPALDVIFQASIISAVNVEINIGYELFKAAHFDKYAFGIGYHFPLYGCFLGKQLKTTFIPSIEPSIIGRWGTEWQTISSHLSLGGNLALRWNLSDKIALEYLFNGLPRTDLDARHPELYDKIPMTCSNYFKMIYKIQRSFLLLISLR